MKTTLKKALAVFLMATLLLLSVSACSSPEAASSGTTSKIIISGGGPLAETSLKKLTDQSVTIVRGKITDMESFVYHFVYEPDPEFNEDLVRTNITVQVDDVLKGEAKREVVFWTTGGETDTVIWEDSFLDSYSIGYEGYFFIGEEGSSYPYLEIRNNQITVPSYITVAKEAELYAKVSPVSGSVQTFNPTYKLPDFEAMVKNYCD